MPSKPRSSCSRTIPFSTPAAAPSSTAKAATSSTPRSWMARRAEAGAIAGVARIKNPITAAHAVMEKTNHVFLIGEGAERFARDQGLTMVSPLYFWTEPRWKEMKKAEKDAAMGKTAAANDLASFHFGTVGAVAVDAQGNLAAGTSTGGITYVMPGRVGDSPIVGAGTIADNAKLRRLMHRHWRTLHSPFRRP